MTDVAGGSDGQDDERARLVLLDRDVVLVDGPESATFLQGQLSQDIAGLAVGAGSPSFLLEPAGKVNSWLHVTRVADEVFVLDVDAGYAESMTARLERFKLRTKATIRPAPEWRVALTMAPDERVDAADVEGTCTFVRDGLLRVLSRDLDAWSAAAGLPLVEQAATAVAECWRIERGWPAMGHEIAPGETIPAEMGQSVIDASVSFTKGCYTGQELVARIDSRGGNVPRHLRGIRISCDPDTVPAVGSPLTIAGEEKSHLTSVAWSPAHGAALALAIIPRAVTPPIKGDVLGHGALVVALPFD